MKKLIIIVFLVMTSVLQAGETNHRRHRDHHENYRNLTPEQSERIAELRVRLIQNESRLNSEMRRLRTELNGCMMRAEIDMEEYEDLREQVGQIKEERRRHQREYRISVQEIVEGTP